MHHDATRTPARQGRAYFGYVEAPAAAADVLRSWGIEPGAWNPQSGRFEHSRFTDKAIGRLQKEEQAFPYPWDASLPSRPCWAFISW